MADESLKTPRDFTEIALAMADLLRLANEIYCEKDTVLSGYWKERLSDALERVETALSEAGTD